jgi:Glycosyl transferase family 2
VKLAMTLLARNEADIVDAQVAFHLHAGVDVVIAMDNGSTDGTTEILERYARSGHLHLLHEPSDDMRQSEWVTQMARMAATDFGADWVINSDADEFWWPRGGSLKDVLALVPERYGVVRGCWRHFLPRRAGHGSFAERMTVRLCMPASPGEKSTIYHAHQKVAHRADPEVEIEPGNHDAVGWNLEPLRGWHPIEVLHFSLRSVEQLGRKGQGGWRKWPAEEQTDHQICLDTAYSEGTLEEFLAEHEVSEADLERGLAAGTLAVDTRLRDALRSLRDGDQTFVLPGDAAPLDFSAPSIDEEAAFAAEVSVLAEIDAIPRAEERVSVLESRLAALRTLPRR